MANFTDLPNELIHAIFEICCGISIDEDEDWLLGLRCVSRRFEVNIRHVANDQWLKTRQFNAHVMRGSWMKHTLLENVMDREGMSEACPLVALILDTCEYIVKVAERAYPPEEASSSHIRERYWRALCAAASETMGGDKVLMDLTEGGRIAISPRILSESEECMLQSIAFIAAAYENDSMILQTLLREGHMDINITDRFFGNPLIAAVNKGNLYAVKLILARPGRNIRVRCAGNSVLHCALRKGHLAILEALLAEPDIDVNAQDDEHESPLLIALRQGKELEASMLANHKGTDIGLDMDPWRGSLALAVAGGYTEIVKSLTERGEFSIALYFHQLRSPLRYAIEGGHGEILEVLLDRGNCYGDSKESICRKCLHVATELGQEDIFRLLLDKYKVPIDAEVPGRTSAIIGAADCGHEAIVRLCLSRIDSYSSFFTNHHLLAMFAATDMGRANIVKLLLDSYDTDNSHNRHRVLHRAVSQPRAIPVLKMMMDRDDVDINRDNIWSPANNDRAPPLVTAVYHSNEEAVAILLDQTNIDVNTRAAEERTALWYAARRKEQNITRLLLSNKNIQPNLADSRGSTPLAEAVRQGNTEAVEILIGRDDVDIHSRDKKGNTPLSLAREYGDGDIIRLLEEELDLSENYRRGSVTKNEEHGWGHDKIHPLLSKR
ncbi:Ankyrin repeat domain-containing protein 60 [Onygenales sp. PD_12]|nr:Ankyrin repeat domain-containing protein 60 [Onygenales sp. PD_12]